MTSTSTRTWPPRADCIADSAGGLTFDMAGEPSLGAALVLRRRGGKGAAAEMRLPLTPSGEEGRLRAVLPSTVELAEGRWDAFTTLGDGAAEQRVEPGLRDLRSLVDRAPETDRTQVVVRIPYPTADGSLAVRCWLRAPHAESGALTVGQSGQSGMTAEGRLYGIGLATGAVVEARLRGNKDLVHRVPVAGTGDGAFTFTLPYGPLAEGRGDEQRLWDLWLCPTGPHGAAGVRIGRILDDIWEKKGIFRYPVLPVEGAGVSRPTTAYPYFTVDNDLSIRLDNAK
ncbi:transferase [Streptomyces sp. 21So2-11]|uniref:transferase n=1 Tax=Streptomyces sp. 21So2-11 TaxID=3144408 RepID=UPI00321BE24F